jgi:hypothetical protein
VAGFVQEKTSPVHTTYAVVTPATSPRHENLGFFVTFYTCKFLEPNTLLTLSHRIASSFSSTSTAKVDWSTIQVLVPFRYHTLPDFAPASLHLRLSKKPRVHTFLSLPPTTPIPYAVSAPGSQLEPSVSTMTQLSDTSSSTTSSFTSISLIEPYIPQLSPVVLYLRLHTSSTLSHIVVSSSSST